MFLQKEAAGRGSKGGAQPEHQLHRNRNHAQRQRQQDQIEGAGHVIGEQPQRAAAAQLGEAVKKAAFRCPAFEIGQVGHILAVQVTGKHGSIAKGPEAQQQIDAAHQHHGQCKAENQVIPLRTGAGCLCLSHGIPR